MFLLNLSNFQNHHQNWDIYHQYKAKLSDGAVLVINSGTVKYRFAQEVKAQLQKSGCKILGVVLNKVGRKKLGGHYDGYYNGYGGYYKSERTKKKTWGKVGGEGKPTGILKPNTDWKADLTGVGSAFLRLLAFLNSFLVLRTA